MGGEEGDVVGFVMSGEGAREEDVGEFGLAVAGGAVVGWHGGFQVIEEDAAVRCEVVTCEC